jgi:hypothetical protein
MLALDPENDYKSVDIVVFGGQKKDFECPHVKEIATTAMAGHTSYRMTITWEEAGLWTARIRNCKCPGRALQNVS